MSRGMKVDDLMRDLKDNPEAAAAVQRQLGDRSVLKPGRAANVIGMLPPAPNAKAHGPAPKRTDGYRSKAEADYAAWLGSMANLVWRHERLSVGLPGVRSRYKPDFTLRWTGPTPFHPDVPFDRYCVEVKGTKKGEPYWREGAKRRASDGAAELWDALRLPLFVAWRVKGEWKHARVEVRP